MSQPQQVQGRAARKADVDRHVVLGENFLCQNLVKLKAPPVFAHVNPPRSRLEGDVDGVGSNSTPE